MTNQEEGKWARRCWKPIAPMGASSIANNFHETLFIFLMVYGDPYAKVGSSMTLNGWDLSSQQVTPNAAYFLDVASKLSYL